MAPSENQTIEILEKTIRSIHRYVIPIFIILGDIGIFFNILIFWKKSWRKNVCVFYFTINLITNTLYINFVMLIDCLTGYDINAHDFNQIYCKLYMYIVEVLSILSPTTLILASIDRLLISSQNVETRLYSSKRLAYFLVIINTLFWMIYNVHILIKVHVQKMRSEKFECYYDLSPFYLNFVTHSMLFMNCFCSLTMIILCLFALKNVRHIRSLPRQHIRRMTKKDFQLIRCLFAEDIVYIIFSIGIPIYKVYAAATIDKDRALQKLALFTFLKHIIVFSHHIPYCTSFYVYLMVSKAFRHELKRYLYRLIGKTMITLRDEENK